MCAILNDIVCLVEYKDKFGNIDHNISFDAGKVFYDIENALFVNYKNKRIRNEYKAIE